MGLIKGTHVPSPKGFYQHLPHDLIFQHGENMDDHHSGKIWMFPKIRVPQNGWFIMENPVKVGEVGDLGVPLFLETPI